MDGNGDNLERVDSELLPGLEYSSLIKNIFVKNSEIRYKLDEIWFLRVDLRDLDRKIGFICDE